MIELVGNEKQIELASELRDDFFRRFDEMSSQEEAREESRLEKRPDDEQLVEKVNERRARRNAARKYFASKNMSSFWIDTRDASIKFMLETASEKIDALVRDEQPELKVVLDASVIYPPKESQKSMIVADARNYGCYAEITSIDSEEAIEAIEEMGWTYSEARDAWTYSIDESTGTAEERIAEAGNALLSTGLPVRIVDEETRRRAVEGDFEPTYPFWIVFRQGKIAPLYPLDDEDMQRLIAGLRFSHFSKRQNAYIFNDAFYDEIRAFAEIHGFRISPTADSVLSDAEKIESARLRVKPSAGKDGSVVETVDLKKILESSRDVIDDLKDDD